MPKIDIDAAPTGHGTAYPDDHAGPCLSRAAAGGSATRLG